VSALQNENGLSYQHQTWYTWYTLWQSLDKGWRPHHARMLKWSLLLRPCAAAATGVGLHVVWLLRFLAITVVRHRVKFCRMLIADSPSIGNVNLTTVTVDLLQSTMSSAAGFLICLSAWHCSAQNLTNVLHCLAKKYYTQPPTIIGDMSP